MGDLKEARDVYDHIQIPEELQKRVQAELDRHAAARFDASGRRRTGRAAFRVAAAAAGTAVFFTAALNISPAFAAFAAQVPVVGPVAQVLTFRSYGETAEWLEISVEIPAISTIDTELSGTAEAVNEEILALCEEYAERAKTRAAEYHEAFIATGGTEEEWALHDLQVKVWYEVKNQTDRYLSFTVTGTESWNAAGTETGYYNLDTATGGHVTLEQLLGPDYEEIANESIRAQMKEREDVAYWTAEEGGFQGITEETNFYLDDQNQPVIVFAPYEIAPGAAGTQEFTIIRRNGI